MRQLLNSATNLDTYIHAQNPNLHNHSTIYK